MLVNVLVSRIHYHVFLHTRRPKRSYAILLDYCEYVLTPTSMTKVNVRGKAHAM